MCNKAPASTNEKEETCSNTTNTELSQAVITMALVSSQAQVQIIRHIRNKLTN